MNKDILYSIFQYIRFDQLFQLKYVSKLFYNVCNEMISTVLLKYKDIINQWNLCIIYLFFSLYI